MSFSWTESGHLETIFRYPVKSMAGERLEAVDLGWHGVASDRRLAFRRLEDQGGFPWLTAGKLAELLPGRRGRRPATGRRAALERHG
jgi:uncharacterized protein